MTDEEIQRKYCSNSRAGGSEKPGRMGQRLVRNVLEAIPYFERFGKDISVLDVGCGDGLGMQVFKDNGFDSVCGVEYVQERVDVARKYNLAAVQGSADDLATIKIVGSVQFFSERECNIFCSHTLEHVRNQGKALQEMQCFAKNLVYMLVPVEREGRSGNAAHFSPIGDLAQLRDQFPKEQWSVVREEYRWNLEPEGLLIMQRR